MEGLKEEFQLMSVDKSILKEDHYQPKDQPRDQSRDQVEYEKFNKIDDIIIKALHNNFTWHNFSDLLRKIIKFATNKKVAKKIVTLEELKYNGEQAAREYTGYITNSQRINIFSNYKLLKYNMLFTINIRKAHFTINIDNENNSFVKVKYPFTNEHLEVISYLDVVYLEIEVNSNGIVEIPNLPDNIVSIILSNERGLRMTDCHFTNFPKYLQSLTIPFHSSVNYIEKLPITIKYLYTSNSAYLESTIIPINLETLIYDSRNDRHKPPYNVNNDSFTLLPYGIKTVILSCIFGYSFDILPPSIENLYISTLFAPLCNLPISLKRLFINEIYEYSVCSEHLNTDSKDGYKPQYKPEDWKINETPICYVNCSNHIEYIYKPRNIEFNENLEELILNSWNALQILEYITVLPPKFKTLTIIKIAAYGESAPLEIYIKEIFTKKFPLVNINSKYGVYYTSTGPQNPIDIFNI